MHIITLKQVEAYLLGYQSSRWTYKLDRMRELVTAIGHPERQLRVIHVGGTAGKGSTCYMAASILEEAGYKVGLHMTPHLISITERMMINRKPIPEKRFITLLTDMTPIIEKLHPTYYEITVAMMFTYFAEEQVDIAVIEVGLGGKLDGTNVLAPAVSVVTNIGLDHTEILGNTVEKIASDKREIIKPGIPAVSGVTQTSVQKLVIEKAKNVSAPLSLLNRDFFINNLKINHGITFNYISKDYSLNNIHLSLLGRHQAANAALAITAVRLCGLPVSDDAITHALSSLHFAGRLEIHTFKNTTFLIDGAHNPMKISALSQALADHFPKQTFPVLIAVKQDKNIQEMIHILAPFVSHWFVTTLERQTDWGKRVMFETNNLAEIIGKVDPKKPITEIQHFPKFLKQYSQNNLLITGSLYLVGAVEEFLSIKRNR